MLSYHGGRKDCLWLKENMSVVHVQRLVKEVLGEGLKGRQMWYNMKYDRREVLLLGKDVDVTKLINRNEEYAYIYVGGEENRYLLHDNAAVGVGGVQEGTSVGGNGKRTVDGGRNTEGEVAGVTSGRGSGSGSGNS